MIPNSIGAIELANIEALVKNRTHETRSLEFKVRVPSGSDEDKNEFVRDVAAMANAGGGDFVFGVSDVDGVADEIVGLPE